MPPLLRFSEIDDEHLIELVASYPILWDSKNDPEYKNVPKKDEVWTEIGKLLNKSCKLSYYFC